MNLTRKKKVTYNDYENHLITALLLAVGTGEIEKIPEIIRLYEAVRHKNSNPDYIEK